MWGVWKRELVTISVFIIVLPAHRIEGEDKAFLWKNLTHHPLRVQSPLPFSFPLYLSHHRCHTVLGLKSTITFSSNYATVSSLWGTRVGEPESLITKLGSPHILPRAGLQIQFLFTSPQQWVRPMANNKWCTTHSEAAWWGRKIKWKWLAVLLRQLSYL